MATLVRKNFLGQTLSSEPQPGKRLLEPLKSFAIEHSLPFKILEENNVVNTAEIHESEGDLWICLEGTVTFICGGTLGNPQRLEKDPREWKGDSIDGGEEFILHPDDILWIPAREPHLHKTDGVTRLLIVKIPERI
ncbi:hypothetical protein A2935_01625 [Candidatus Wolfebacteria bacterium RIFCSPLOWO2_01_FULL_47_17b]|uniref:Cupin n=1 Tax=Candidatus Wolfebacteria bacterium RIFCSPLOWO2_01_FULL_47_17b TaxID=1802558 RepID=A0A1F8DYQ7_9BACT|nr:MAG: hypothetical protein A2935_01625 [Candidatus Wolfebacteria bacterium RIFCSPLOWO2_01_FULL_47_17b]